MTVKLSLPTSGSSGNTTSISEQQSFAELFKNISQEGQNRAEDIITENMSEDVCSIFDENGLITTDIEKLEQILFSGYQGLEIQNTYEENSYWLEYDSDGDGTFDRVLRYAIDEATGEMIKEYEEIIDDDNSQELVLLYWNGEVADVGCNYNTNYSDENYTRHSYYEDTAIDAAESGEYSAGRNYDISRCGEVINLANVSRNIRYVYGDFTSGTIELDNGDVFKYVNPSREDGDEYTRWIYAE